MYLERYKDNLRVEGVEVYSYETLVARIDHSARKVYRLGWWSMTTSKHINYVARELGYEVEDAPKAIKEAENKRKEGERESALGGMMKSVAMVCAMGEIMCDKPEDRNAFKKRIISTLPGIKFPEDWDKLSEEEKARRLKGGLEALETKPKA